MAYYSKRKHNKINAIYIYIYRRKKEKVINQHSNWQTEVRKLISTRGFVYIRRENTKLQYMVRDPSQITISKQAMGEYPEEENCMQTHRRQEAQNANQSAQPLKSQKDTRESDSPIQPQKTLKMASQVACKLRNLRKDLRTIKF